MNDSVYLSTAYLPPIEYIFHILNANKVIIEKEENYHKQTYRNRCNILSSNGIFPLSVPIVLCPDKKTIIKDARIDYSKRWQQVHIRAIMSAYGSAPFFIYYFDEIERIISTEHKYLLDLNNQLLETILRFLKIKRDISFTDSFLIPEGAPNDHRYDISPKIESQFTLPNYPQLFALETSAKGLSIIDILFNCGEYDL